MKRDLIFKHEFIEKEKVQSCYENFNCAVFKYLFKHQS